MGGERILVRRAHAGDVDRVAEFVGLALGGRDAIDGKQVMDRLGDVGFLLAEEEGGLVGLIGWRVENLVARVTDLLVWPSHKRDLVGPALFREMEAAARGLQAEAAVLFMPRSGGAELLEFGESLGYEPRVIADMPEAWRETAYEAGREDDEEILVKELRSERVVRPL